MKKLYTVLIFVISTLLVGNLATAQVLNLWIDGDRVVYDTQNNKYFYPHLENFFGMTLSQHLDAIGDLEYAKIDGWRIGLYHDMIPLKKSMLGGMIPSVVNDSYGFDSRLYFKPTAVFTMPPNPMGFSKIILTMGRTGDEWGDPNSKYLGEFGNGAMIESGPPSPPYAGTPVPDRVNSYYTTIPTEAQDHWVILDEETMHAIYDDDLNYQPENSITALNPGGVITEIGAWAVYGGPEVAEKGELDIRPWSKRNLVNPDSRWFLPVAILSNQGFKANKIDLSSIRIGPDPGGEVIYKRRRHLRDVDRDGDKDLILYFKISETGIQEVDKVWGFYAETKKGKGYIFMDNIETYTRNGWGNWGGLKGAPEEFDGEELLAFEAEVYPNPFSHEANIRFQLPEAGHVTLRVYNMMGQEIQMLANTPYEEGSHIVTWNGADMSGNEAPAGIYFYRLEVGDQVLTDRILLIR